MPNTRAAKKALRQSEKHKTQNLQRTRTMRALVKSVRELVAKNDTSEAAKLLPETYKAIDKAAKTGVIKQNTASRKKSRLTKLISKNTTS